LAAGLAASLAMIAGCGNAYRSVESTIGVVGPAGQPTKYAIAVSSPSATSNGLMTMVDFSGDTVLVTASLGVNPYYLALNATGTIGFTLNSDKTVNTFTIVPTLITSQIQQTTLLAGAAPVSLYATSTSTFMADPGVNPIIFPPAIDQLTGVYTPALQQELPVAAGYAPVYMVGQSGASRIYGVSQSTSGGAGQAEVIENANSSTLSPTISTTLPVGRGPVYGVMTTDLRRAFILNQTDGTVTVINAQTNALDQFGPSITGFSIAGNVVTFTAQNTLLAGASVTIAGLSTGTYLNGQTLTVLPAGLSSTQFEAAFTHANVASTADAGTAAITNSTIPVGVRPVWADLAPGLNELVVVNEGTGTSNGSVTLINIPLCMATALPTNPNCDATNPIDATQFGTVAATIPVGVNPIMVSVLSDYTRAYVANAGIAGLPCAAVAVPNVSTTCTVSVVNLATDTVTATIPINGHPAYIATANSTPTGKVYVVCKDSQVMTVIETDTDTLYTTIPLQGYGVSVRMTSP
jgi:DNA-binding beta-propeller fold protein YncE